MAAPRGNGPMYAGIAGCLLADGDIELVPGVKLTTTYCHFMAPFLVAFAPATLGAPHPGPWIPGGGGLAWDIHAELSLSRDFHLERWFDRVNTVWWTVAFIRLVSGIPAQVPFFSTKPISDLQEAQGAAVRPFEINPDLRLGAQGNLSLSEDHIETLTSLWLTGGRLMRNDRLSAAVQAYDASHWARSSNLALLELWGGLERLFSAGRFGTRFAVPAATATFLEAPGENRYALFRELQELYDARSGVAHGSRKPHEAEALRTRDIFRAVLLRTFQDDKAPEPEEFEMRLFGVKGA